jgi:hypothetical protein
MRWNSRIVVQSSFKRTVYLGRGFPFYCLNGQDLYDLHEVRNIFRASRLDIGRCTPEPSIPTRNIWTRPSGERGVCGPPPFRAREVRRR